MNISMMDVTGNVNFKWDMTAKEFKKLYRPLPKGTEEYEYLGAVFFGNFKLEFCQNQYGGYQTLFQYGEEGYDYLEDGTPYCELIEEGESIIRPWALTFDGFAQQIEQQVMALLNRRISMIFDAIVPTEPNKWYPGERIAYAPTDFTREN